MISSENPFIKTDIGILTDINLEDAISQYLQNSQINLFSDSSRGGILFSIKYINVNEESPFYQYVFGNSCASRERQSVKELFIKFVLFSRNKNGRNISFQYEIPNTLTIRKVKLHETLQDEIQREFVIKFFELNSLKMLNDKQRTQMERNKKVQYRFNRLFIYELFKLFDDGNGYVHNDIHYGNVLYDENNSNPVVYLIDFGRSKSCQEYEKLYEQLQIQPSLFHRNAKEYLTQYFKYLLPQITKYGQENNGEKIKVSVIKMLLLNYIGLEIISTHNRRIFDTEYVANASYQWFFYFYVKPLLIVNKSKITINFNNKKTNQLVEFIKQRLELDRKISLNFYCNNSQQPDIIPINKTTRKSLGGYKIKSVKRNHLSTIQR